MFNMEETTIHFEDNGAVTAQVMGVPPSLRRHTNLPELKEKLTDINFPVHELSRMISLELISLAQEMNECETDPSLQFRMKSYDLQVKSLRELAKSITETDILSKRDVLNFDGEKFKFVFVEIVGMFKKSLKDAGVNDSLSTNIMKHFADIMRMKEPDLRIQTQKIESSGGIR
jgi:hypothetical protein